MRRAQLRFLFFFYLLSLICFLSACTKPPQSKITIGSKFFTEQVVLAELVAQHIEAKTGIPVIRKTNLGGTLLVHKALLAGELDLYVEYTGTALTAVLNESPQGDSAAVYNRVKQLYADRFHLEVTEPMRKDFIYKKSPTLRLSHPNGARASATNSSSVQTASTAGAIATVSISPNLRKSWTSALSTAPSSIIKWTLSPEIPRMASSTPSPSSPSPTTATISRPTTPSPSSANPHSRVSPSYALPLPISLANFPPPTSAASTTPLMLGMRTPPPSSAPSANPAVSDATAFLF